MKVATMAVATVAKASRRHVSSIHKLTTAALRWLIHGSVRRLRHVPLHRTNLAFTRPPYVIPA
jgi:hypothetical protein